MGDLSKGPDTTRVVTDRSQTTEGPNADLSPLKGPDLMHSEAARRFPNTSKSVLGKWGGKRTFSTGVTMQGKLGVAA